jgi:hypothetical protein
VDQGAADITELAMMILVLAEATMEGEGTLLYSYERPVEENDHGPE